MIYEREFHRAQDEEWEEEEDLSPWGWGAEAPEGEAWSEAYPYELLPDFTLPIGIAAVLFFLVIVTRVGAAPRAEISGPAAETGPSSPAPAMSQPAMEAFAAPYTDYVITQGIHGASYGDMAIDLAGGRGSAVLSPIHGLVTELYTDRYGNPTLIIENDIYRVKMLHGVYSVSVGEVVALGDRVGEEGNLGYTTDWRGVRCAGRSDPCGYHTHLNVFDKRLGHNIDPLDLLGP